jgi:hypothetical protein
MNLKTLRPMSVAGQSRHSDRGLATSGLPRTTDIIIPARLVRLVPIAAIEAVARLTQSTAALASYCHLDLRHGRRSCGASSATGT